MNNLTLCKREKVVEYQTEALFLIFVQVFHVMIDSNILALLVERLVKIGKSKRVQTNEDCTKRYYECRTQQHTKTLSRRGKNKYGLACHLSMSQHE